MTVKFLREVLKHYEDKEYDDWNIALFDYNNQRSLEVLDGTYASSKESKIISFPVKVEPVDGVAIDERLKKILKEVKEGTEKVKETLIDYKNDIDKLSKEALDKINKNE